MQNWAGETDFIQTAPFASKLIGVEKYDRLRCKDRCKRVDRTLQINNDSFGRNVV